MKPKYLKPTGDILSKYPWKSNLDRFNKRNDKPARNDIELDFHSKSPETCNYQYVLFSKMLEPIPTTESIGLSERMEKFTKPVQRKIIYFGSQWIVLSTYLSEVILWIEY